MLGANPTEGRGEAMTTRYRKLPVVIDAVQLPYGLDGNGLYSWACEQGITHLDYGDYAILTVNTLEGQMRIEPGDWLITGVMGEKYPCKPDVFAKTYEAVEEKP
jgi:hypothetical protein